MPQHATLHPPITQPDPADFHTHLLTHLLTRLDEIIGLLDALTTALADRAEEEDAYFPDPSMLLGLDEEELPF